MTNTEKYLGNYTFSLELELLCLCSQKTISDADKQEIIKLSNEKINWKRFFLLTKKHRLYPIVYKNINSLEGFYKDEHTITTLKNMNTRNVINTLKLTKELVKITSEFDKQGIKSLAFKGPTLAIILYNNISSRVYRDLDILVDEKDIDKAISVLLDMGYNQDDFLAVATEKQKKYVIKREHHFCFISKEGTLLELHWRFESENNNFNFERILENITEIDVSGTTLHVLKNEENFLYLVFHGSKHAWMRLRWLNDIAEMIKENKLNWEYIRVESEKLKFDYMIYQALILCNAMYNTDLHEDVLLNIKKMRFSEKLSILCLPYFESTNENEESFSQELQYHVQYRHLWKKYKKQYLSLNIFPTSGEFKKYRIPDRFFFLYYLIRQYCLLKKYVVRKSQ